MQLTTQHTRESPRGQLANEHTLRGCLRHLVAADRRRDPQPSRYLSRDFRAVGKQVAHLHADVEPASNNRHLQASGRTSASTYFNN